MNISEFESFLFFPGQHWNHTWERQHELVSRFAILLNDAEIQVASPTGLVNHNPFSVSFFRRIVSHLKAQSHVGQNPIRDNMKMLNLKYIPFHYNIVGKFNYQMIERQLNFSSNNFFWSTYMNPTVYEFFRRSKFKVYDLAERRSKNKKLPESVKRLERKAVAEANVVFVDNKATFEDYRDLNENIFYIPQGVNMSSFYEKKDVERKYIGYIGNLHFAIDYDYLDKLITINEHQSFLLIGSVMEQDAYKILDHPNVTHINNLPKEELNNYLAQMKVGLIPYVIDDVTVGVYPTKLFEYLAAGVPVISTALPEVVQYANPNYLSIESQPKDLSNISFNRKNISDIVRVNTWDDRWNKYQLIIAQCLKFV